VAAAAIGQELGALSAATGAALVAAGLLSVLLFPAVALGVLRTAAAADVDTTPLPTNRGGQREGTARQARPGHRRQLRDRAGDRDPAR
jgi:hypothetical protein